MSEQVAAGSEGHDERAWQIIGRLEREIERLENKWLALDPCPHCWTAGFEGPCTCSTAARLLSALEEIARLRAIAGALPETADGAPAYPGMLLYHAHPGCMMADGISPQVREETVAGIHRDGFWTVETPADTYQLGEWYSTREAAEAAMDEHEPVD